MAEILVNLGRQRLMVSRHLGNEFTQLVEGQGLEGEGIEPELVSLASQVRQKFAENPATQLIGYKILETDTPPLEAIVGSLCQQMGLPPDGNIRDLRGRLVGREKDFLLVIIGLDHLSSKQKGQIVKEISRLNVESLMG